MNVASFEGGRPPFPLRYRRAVVVSAHPDDETLGCGGLLRALQRAGTALALIVATDGEAAFPGLDGPGRRRLGLGRRVEMAVALRRLGLGDVEPVWLGLPDSALDRSVLAEALRPLVAGADLCLAPWPNDPHRDHRAAGLAARDAVEPGCDVWTFPIWARVDGRPLPDEGAAAYRLAPEDRRAKVAAVDAHASQVGPGPGGRAPVVDGAARRALEAAEEIFFRLAPAVTTPVDRFDRLYHRHPDPWDTAGRFYERRKRAITLASLPRDRYRRAMDAGCGTGRLTAELSERADSVDGFDPVPAAVDSARSATAGKGNVSLRVGRLPTDVGGGPYDLLVFSEVLYYLDRSDLDATLERAEAAAAPGADLVAVDWRPVTPDAPRDADDAHRQLLGRPSWDVLVEHVEEEFVLHVLRRC